MSQDEFTKLFKYMTERFDKIDEKFEKQTSRFDRLDNMIDELLKKQEINEEERLVIGHQLDRLDKWTHELANKIGYKLTA
jgi:hypothetical protein